MRMMMKVHMDTAAASDAIRSGRMPQVIKSLLDQIQPEAAYFGPEGGKRTAFLVFDMDDPAMLPALSEPLYQNFHADVSFFPVMNRQDLERGLSEVAGS